MEEFKDASRTIALLEKQNKDLGRDMNTKAEITLITELSNGPCD